MDPVLEKAFRNLAYVHHVPRQILSVSVPSTLSAVFVELRDMLLVIDSRIVLSFSDLVDCCVRLPAVLATALDVLELQRLVSGSCWLVVL